MISSDAGGLDVDSWSSSDPVGMQPAVVVPGALLGRAGSPAARPRVFDRLGRVCGRCRDSSRRVRGAARFYLTPRISVGPEFVYMVGPGNDRDLILTGNLTFDLIKPIDNRPRRITPYVLAGGGYFQHRNRFVNRTFTASEGAFTGGGGVRLFLTRNLYVAPEARLGWELHQRLTVTIGYLFR